MKNFLPLELRALQHLPDTRCEAHSRATTTISERDAHIVEVTSMMTTLKRVILDDKQNLLQKMEEFQLVFMLYHDRFACTVSQSK